jgi:hypothetical protein
LTVLFLGFTLIGIARKIPVTFKEETREDERGFGRGKDDPNRQKEEGSTFTETMEEDTRRSVGWKAGGQGDRRRVDTERQRICVI